MTCSGKRLRVEGGSGDRDPLSVDTVRQRVARRAGSIGRPGMFLSRLPVHPRGAPPRRTARARRSASSPGDTTK